MESTTEPPKPRDTRRMILAAIVAAIILFAGLSVYLWYSERGHTAAASTDKIASGDSVTMNYIGRLPDGRVFDTSLVDVANDDVLYPKSLTFTHKTNDSYGLFTMEAGKYGVSGGTIKGFALGVIGMKQNETKIIEVAPEDGYAADPTMMRSILIQEDVIGMETFSQAQFAEAFGAVPILFRTYTHFFWGWPVEVVDNTSGLVVVRHMPTAGMIVHPYGDPSADSPYGWDVEVVSYDSEGFDGAGKITIMNHVSAGDVYNIKGIDYDGKTFVISSFDAANGSIEINKVDTTSGYNGEIAGRTLFFEVTIVRFTHPSS